MGIKFSQRPTNICYAKPLFLAAKPTLNPFLKYLLITIVILILVYDFINTFNFNHVSYNTNMTVVSIYYSEMRNNLWHRATGL